MISRLILILPLLIISLGSGIIRDISDDSEPSHTPDASGLYAELDCPELNPLAFQMAYEGYRKLAGNSMFKRDTILTVIDFSKPSVENRFFVIDIKNRRIIEKTLVAHGKNSGLLYAENFSDRPHSNQSSLGFYVTDQTYTGKHGYSLRLKGLEPGINKNAWQRAIVVHGANYVSEDYIKQYGRLGRSFGCPALSYDISSEVINLIKDASCLFIYSRDASYQRQSDLFSSSYFAQINH
ncbi:MAG: murein L,D-transpeptidase catalytic domain family protein [Bacteroidales bacterium]|nr:murein L,D-transpeptidase catalytic domain family protein [Bacteroidales bacterium]